MPLRPGSHAVGPDKGTLRVNTYREGMAQKVGHDLIIEVGEWQAQVEVDESGIPKAVGLEADPPLVAGARRSAWGQAADR
jgi:hypothetical protein